MRTGAVSLWVAGAEEAERAAKIVRDLGYTVSTVAERRVSPSRRFEPSGPLRGELTPPPDKSISHRAALLGAMGEGETRVSRALSSEDTRRDAARRRGARRRGRLRDALRWGARRASPGNRPAGAGAQAGVGRDRNRRRQRRHPAPPAARVARRTGRAAPGRSTVTSRSAAAPSTGSPSHCRRWARPCAAATGGCPPLGSAGAKLHGIEYRLPVASAQVKSCVLLAGLLAEGETSVVEPAPTRDHTERMLRAAGVDVEVEETTVAVRGPAGHRITVRRTDRLEPEPIDVPGDFSSAAFPIVAALLIAGSNVRPEGRRTEPDQDRPARSPAPDGRRGRGHGGDHGRWRAARRRGRPPRPAPGDAGRCRRGAARDRRAAAGRAARMLRRRRDRGRGRRRAAPQGVRPDRGRRRGAARVGRRDRGERRRLRGARIRRAARRRPRRPRRSPPGDARRRSPGWRRGTVSRSPGWRPPPSAIPVSSRTSRR